MAGIYIHVPFCRKACHYCDFHFSTNLSYLDRMFKCIQLEAKSLPIIQEEVTTIYLGGGTPSIMHPSQIEELLIILDKRLKLNIEELTIECNPEDISKEYINHLVSLGFNRVSLGAQTFDDSILNKINRNHSSNQTLKAVEIIKNAGIENFNLDLIYSLPGSTTNTLVSDLSIISSLEPKHISIYSFTVEERTVFGHLYKKGVLETRTEDENFEEFSIIIDTLLSNGFEHYEISNFCLPGFESKHNSSYWKGIGYLGLGPGAHSFYDEKRWYNIDNNVKYMNSIENGSLEKEYDTNSTIDRLNERIITGLRTKWGADLNHLYEKYGIDLAQLKEKEMTQLIQDEMATIDNGILTLTKKGWFIADKISEELMIFDQ